MELNGASLNPDLRKRLTRLGVLRELLLAREPDCGSVRRRVRRRQGLLLEAVADVLELAGRPMRVREVHAAVERLFGERVPFSSVNEAPSTHNVWADARFRRLCYGVFERRK